MTVTEVDIALVGGGIAGLWLLARLRAEGYGTVLIEHDRLGSGQTLLSQGIIHGGTKYTLQGELSTAAKAIAEMPARWRRCLAGDGEIDLSATRLLTSHQHVWTTASLGSRLTAFFASKAMRSRITPLPPSHYPVALIHEHFHGKVYRLDEPVVEVGSLLQNLALPHEHALLACQEPVRLQPNGALILSAVDRETHTIRPRRTVFTAGIGNAALPWAAVQSRPLHMVMVRGETLPSDLYAHCLAVSDVPRLTITSHRDLSGRTVWYLGGQLAEEGIDRDHHRQIAEARRELIELLPWVDWSRTQFSTFRTHRIEARHPDGKRPNTPTINQNGTVIAAWPTKLALAPMLADEVLSRLKQDRIYPRDTDLTGFTDWPRPALAPYPWDEEDRRWY